ncbi:hypothetical protein CGZ92_04765 [Parenemella sanctibonifatiensis]|uniref:HTH lacI-type domain-containing protein n=2 Tax=Parenemella sanctibonifatiensis TaxID=2016505 RepID=A0A255E9X0_9ACTN|nr:hypothetical protein CGZ92_04765 [Parenemella sanctibonifatiensis]
MAEVSRSTASRALNANGYVAARVRERVLAAADDLGYLADVAARGFKSGRGTTVGLLVSDLRAPLHADVTVGVSDRLAGGPYTFMVAHTSKDPDRQLQLAHAFAARRVEGVILTPLGDEVHSSLHRLGVPVVEVDGFPSGEDCDRVLPAAEAAGRFYAERMDEPGFEQTLLVIDAAPTASQLELVRGCSAIVGSPGGGRLRTGTLSELGPDPLGPDPWAAHVAVLAGTPDLGAEIWASMLRSGASATRDRRLSLVCFGDATWMRLVVPSVSALRTDGKALGAQAAQRLMSRLEDRDAPTVIDRIPVVFVERQTRVGRITATCSTSSGCAAASGTSSASAATPITRRP